MSRKNPVSLARKLVKRYNTRDPFEIADILNITVQFQDFKKQKGAFNVVVGGLFIYININLSYEMQRIVCAHELGHALLHKSLVRSALGFLEFELFDMTDHCEYDANVFAAALLLDNDDTMEAFYTYNDYVKAAREMNVNVNLLLVKAAELINEGYNLRVPKDADCRFLGNCGDDAGEL